MTQPYDEPLFPDSSDLAETQVPSAQKGPGETPSAVRTGLHIDASDPNAWVGARVGRYEILRPLGRGGQAIVFLGREEGSARSYAIKVFSIEGLLPAEALRRFEREAKVSSALQIDGVCRVHDTIVEEGYAALVLDYIEGESLAGFIASSLEHRARSRTALPRCVEFPSDLHCSDAGTPLAKTAWEIDRILCFFEKVARILHAAHSEGVIHRDLKPSNLMVDLQGEAVILDFGLARCVETAGFRFADDAVTQDGVQLGSPSYMAPEQVRGNAAHCDARTDVFALGVCLYEALTLQRPFKGRDRETLYRDILVRTPPSPLEFNPSLPRSVLAVLEKTMEKRPSSRYRNARQLAEDLANLRAGRRTRARSAGPIRRFRRWSRSQPMTAAALVFVIGMLLTALTGASVALHYVSEARAVAEQRQYIAALTAAQAAIGLGFESSAYASLDSCPEALRGFEWHWLRSKLDTSVGSCRADGAPTRSAAISAKSSRVRGLGRDGKIREWRLSDQTLLGELDFLGDGSIIADAWSSDGEHLAAVTNSDRKYQLHVFSFVSRRVVLREILEGISSLDCLAISPQGRFCAIGGAARESRGVYVAALLRFRVQSDNTADRILISAQRTISEAVVTDQGLVVAQGVDRLGRSSLARLWAMGQEPMQLLAESEELIAPCVAMSIDASGRRITAITSGQAPTMMQWALARSGRRATFRLYGRFPCGFQKAAALCIDPDGLCLLTSTDKGRIDLWKGDFGAARLELRGSPRKHLRLGFDVARQFVVGVDDLGTIRLWRVAAARRERLVHRDSPTGSEITFGPMGKLLLCTNPKIGVTAWQSSSGRLAFQELRSGMREMRLESKGRAGPFSMSYLVVHGVAGRIAEGLARQGVAEARTEPEIVASFEFDGIRRSARYRDFVALLGFDGHVIVRDCGNMAVLYQNAKMDASRGLAFLNRGRQLVALSKTGLLTTVDFESGRRTPWKIPLPASTRCVATDLASTRMAIGYDDGRVYVLDLAAESGRWLEDPSTSSVQTLCFWPGGGNRLVAGTRDGHVCFWDLSTGDFLLKTAAYPESISSLACNPNGMGLALRLRGGRIYLLSTQNMHALDAIQEQPTEAAYDLVEMGGLFNLVLRPFRGAETYRRILEHAGQLSRRCPSEPRLRGLRILAQTQLALAESSERERRSAIQEIELLLREPYVRETGVERIVRLLSRLLRRSLGEPPGPDPVRPRPPTLQWIREATESTQGFEAFRILQDCYHRQEAPEKVIEDATRLSGRREELSKLIRRIVERESALSSHTQGLVRQARLLLLEPRLERNAYERARRCLMERRRSSIQPSMAEGWIALAELRCGRLDVAERSLRARLALHRFDYLRRSAFAQVCMALLLLERGERGAALDLHERYLRPMASLSRNEADRNFQRLLEEVRSKLGL